MQSLNKIVVIGECVDPVDSKVTNNGESFAKLKLRAERPERSDGMPSQADIIPVVMWRSVADKAQVISVGDIVLVEGRILTRTYDDDQGVRHWETEVEAREIKKITGGSSNSDSSTPRDSSHPREFDREALAVSLEESPLETGEKKFSFEGLSDLSQTAPSGQSDIDMNEEEVPF